MLVVIKVCRSIGVTCAQSQDREARKKLALIGKTKTNNYKFLK